MQKTFEPKEFDSFLGLDCLLLFKKMYKYAILCIRSTHHLFFSVAYKCELRFFI